MGDWNSYGSTRSGHLRTTEKMTQSSEMHCRVRSLINCRLPFYYFSRYWTVGCCIWNVRLSRLFSTLRNANRTKNQKSASDDIVRREAIFRHPFGDSCLAASRRQRNFFYFSSDLRFEGLEITLKVWPFVSSNHGSIRWNIIKYGKRRFIRTPIGLKMHLRRLAHLFSNSKVAATSAAVAVSIEIAPYSHSQLIPITYDDWSP